MDINTQQIKTDVLVIGDREQLATELQAPLLGHIYLDTRICSGSDAGNPIAIKIQFENEI